MGVFLLIPRKRSIMLLLVITYTQATLKITFEVRLGTYFIRFLMILRIREYTVEIRENKTCSGYAFHTYNVCREKLPDLETKGMARNFLTESFSLNQQREDLNIIPGRVNGLG